MRICSVEGCAGTVLARGWCEKHYRKLRVAACEKGVCSVDDCVTGAHIRGMCPLHYARWKRTGSTEPTRMDNQGKSCSIGGCLSPAKVRGWCPYHYSRWKRLGDPEAAGVGQGRRHVPCPVCYSPIASEIDGRLMDGASLRSIASTTEVSLTSLRRHAREHLHMPEIPSKGCEACVHERVADLDELLMMQRRVAEILGIDHVKGSIGTNALASRFGLTKDIILNHNTPEHQQRRLTYELGRLNALKETA